MRRLLILGLSLVSLFVLKLYGQNASFTSPDLAIFDAHGPVKTITYTAGQTVPFADLEKTPIMFDRQGRCTNIVRIAAGRSGASSMKVQRNNAGYLTKIVSKKGLLLNTPTDFVFSWTGKQLSSYSFEIHPAWGWRFDIKYQGSKISSISYMGGGDGIGSEGQYTFSNFKYDSKGNWIECTVKCKNIEIDELDDTYTPDPVKTYRVKRTISYY